LVKTRPGALCRINKRRMLKIWRKPRAKKKGGLRPAKRPRKRNGPFKPRGATPPAPTGVKRLRVKNPVTAPHHSLGVRAVGKADAWLERLIVHRLRILLAKAGRTPVAPGERQPAWPVIRPGIRSEVKKRHIVALLRRWGGDVPSQPIVQA